MVESIQKTLEQFDPGIIWLDQNNVITAMNAVASDTFEDGKADLIGQQVLDIHPKKSREKIKCMLDQLSNTTNPLPPMTVMLNNPERVLLIKLSAMRSRCRKLVWLNPLIGKAGYEPRTRAMLAAMPHLDLFASAHNLQSLAAFEPVLAEL